MPRLEAPLPVFVYGTLRPGAARGPAAARLAREATCLGPARVRGRLYRVHWYPGLVPSTAEEWVLGDLFALPHRGGLLQALDAYERFRPSQPKRGDFRRDVWEVTGPEGPVRAWVYGYHGPVSERLRIQSGDFLNR